MNKFYLLSYLTLIPVTIQHFAKPPSACVSANLCNHTWVPICGKEESDQSVRVFSDDCDILEYNCDYKKNFKKTSSTECPDFPQSEEHTKKSATQSQPQDRTTTSATTTSSTLNSAATNLKSSSITTKPSSNSSETTSTVSQTVHKCSADCTCGDPISSTTTKSTSPTTLTTTTPATTTTQSTTTTSSPTTTPSTTTLSTTTVHQNSQSRCSANCTCGHVSNITESALTSVSTTALSITTTTSTVTTPSTTKTPTTTVTTTESKQSHLRCSENCTCGHPPANITKKSASVVTTPSLPTTTTTSSTTTTTPTTTTPILTTFISTPITITEPKVFLRCSENCTCGGPPGNITTTVSIALTTTTPPTTPTTTTPLATTTTPSTTTIVTTTSLILPTHSKCCADCHCGDSNTTPTTTISSQTTTSSTSSSSTASTTTTTTTTSSTTTTAPTTVTECTRHPGEHNDCGPDTTDATDSTNTDNTEMSSVKTDVLPIGDSTSVPTSTLASTTVSNCDASYPHDCGRPHSWETTLAGERRDYFQIMKGKIKSPLRFEYFPPYPLFKSIPANVDKYEEQNLDNEYEEENKNDIRDMLLGNSQLSNNFRDDFVLHPRDVHDMYGISRSIVVTNKKRNKIAKDHYSIREENNIRVLPYWLIAQKDAMKKRNTRFTNSFGRKTTRNRKLNIKRGIQLNKFNPYAPYIRKRTVNSHTPFLFSPPPVYMRRQRGEFVRGRHSES